MLDVGCGNGRLLAFLAERGWGGQYVGVDSSSGLLSVAAGNARRGVVRAHEETGAADASLPSGFASACFVQADLLDLGWRRALGSFVPAAIACLAVLHHVPGAAQRARLVAECAGLLQPGGVLILSTWQFLSAPRLQARILPWREAGLRDEDVEPGDYLIAWGAGAAGRRYCAAIDSDALCDLARRAGLTPAATFFADGHEGNLNLYGVFQLIAT